MTAASSIGVAQHARLLTVAQLEREIACAESCGADADYVATLREILEERSAGDRRETLPAPPEPDGEPAD